MKAGPRCGGRAAGFGTHAVLVAAMALAAVGGAAAADPPPPGIAARYAGDLGFAKDPAVLFADDFESWTEGGTQPPPGAWSVRRNNVSQTRVIPGKVAPACPGGHVLEIACWTEGKGSQTGGLSRRLGNYNHAGEGLGDGHDELYVRYYLKFDENYRAVQNHGANLGGRDLKMKAAAWVGMAGIRDTSTRGYFYSGLQPYAKQGSRELEMGFYSYHLDKRGPWGENYEVARRLPVEVGTWHSVERHMKLNSVDPAKADPAVADGVEELWVDGVLTIRKAGVRFRRVPHLRITFFSLETYYHGLPAQYGRDSPIKVYIDNVVIARAYVGPLAGGR